MKKHRICLHKWILLVLFTPFSFLACTRSWTKIISDGHVNKEAFVDSLTVEKTIGLMIVPVEINGEKYRFLFDSGAPTSISKTLNKALGFKIISKSNLSDSDNSVAKFDFVRIDSLFIASVPFYDQTAFVGDFSANPTLACLDLDGIIGSNTQRFCNWKIMSDSNKIYLSSELFDTDSIEYSSIPFSSDDQYNVKIDLSSPKGKITNIKVDYGSNGEIGISSSLLDKMIEREMVSTIYYERGYAQSGIIGALIEKNRRISMIDSLFLGDHLVEKVTVKTGANGLLGNAFLSRQEIIIDWTNQQLHLKRNSKIDENETFGFGLAQSDSLGLIIRSIIEGGPADKAGLKPMMKIIRYGNLDFDRVNDICDYISTQDQVYDSLQISILGKERETTTYTVYKQKLFK